MTTCTTCPRPLRDEEAGRTACERCEHRIRAQLRELIARLPLLDASLQRDRVPAGTTRPAGLAHAPLPLRGDVLSLTGPAPPGTVRGPAEDQEGRPPLAATLAEWLWLVAAERGTDGPPRRATIPQLATRLAAALPWAVRHSWIADLSEELTGRLNEVRRITHTEPRRRILAAPCACGAFALLEEEWQEWIECELCGRLYSHTEYDHHAATVLPPLYRTALHLALRERTTMTDQTVRVRVVLTIGDQAEIVADVPPEDRAASTRYPAADIAAAAGVDIAQLPGTVLLADVDDHDQLHGWRRP